MTIAPIENKSGIDLGILGTHLGFLDALVPDEEGNLPRNSDGELVVFAGSRDICELSPVKVDVIQISSFGSTKSEDMDERHSTHRHDAWRCFHTDNVCGYCCCGSVAVGTDIAATLAILISPTETKSWFLIRRFKQ